MKAAASCPAPMSPPRRPTPVSGAPSSPIPNGAYTLTEPADRAVPARGQPLRLPRRSSRPASSLQVNANPVINVTLPLGQLSETVSVEAAAPLVETRNPSIGQVIENERIEELPLNGRNPADLIQLAGAAVPTGRAVVEPQHAGRPRHLGGRRPVVRRRLPARRRDAQQSVRQPATCRCRSPTRCRSSASRRARRTRRTASTRAPR